MRLIPLVLLIVLVIMPIDVLGNRIVLADFTGDPSYNILTQTSQTQLNPGDRLRIELFITGLGDIESSKIFVTIPDKLPNIETINFTKRKYNHTDSPKFEPYYKTGHFGTNFYHLIPKDMYMMVDLSSIKGLEEAFQGADLSGPSGLVLGETRTTCDPTYSAPYTIDFITAENASAGDYRVHILYTYGYLGKWYQDEEFVDVHVNHIYEREYFKWIIYIVTFLAAVCGLEYIIKFLICLRSEISHNQRP